MNSLESLDYYHSLSFLMTLSNSLSSFVIFLSYRWLFNVATSFVNGPLYHTIPYIFIFNDSILRVTRPRYSTRQPRPCRVKTVMTQRDWS